MQHAITIPDPETNVVDPRGWARDLAWLSASTALVPLVFGVGLGYVAITALAGALVGRAIGTAAPALLARRVRKIPVVLLLGAGAGLGANMGAAAALIAALASNVHWMRVVEYGATAGMIQLGVFWLPAALLRARGRSTMPALIGALALGPLAALYLVLRA